MSERAGKLRTLATARQRFKESCTDTLAESKYKPPLASAQLVWAIPTDLVMHGFSVEMTQSSTVFTIEIERSVSGHLFRAVGTGKSLLEALKALELSAKEGFDAVHDAIDQPQPDVAA